MRYRVRGILKAGNLPVIHKIDAPNAYAAASEAGRILKDEGHDPAGIESLTVKPMAAGKSQQTYFGKPSTGRKGVKPGTRAETPAASAPAAEQPVLPAIDGPSPANPAVQAENVTETKAETPRKRR